mgnify:CR=1 FL=1
MKRHLLTVFVLLGFGLGLGAGLAPARAAGDTGGVRVAAAGAAAGLVPGRTAGVAGHVGVVAPHGPAHGAGRLHLDLQQAVIGAVACAWIVPAFALDLAMQQAFGDLMDRRPFRDQRPHLRGRPGLEVCAAVGSGATAGGEGGGKRYAAEKGLDYLGALPLNMQIRLQADNGKPTVVSDPDGEVAGIYKAVARQVAVKVAAKAKDFSSKFPSIKISKDT